MGFFSGIEGPVMEVINMLLKDTDLQRYVTIKVYKSSTFSTSLGHEVITYTSYTDIVGIELTHSKKSALVGNSNIAVGDIVYIFRYDDLPESLSLKDMIVTSSGSQYRIKSINPIFELVTLITLEGE